MNKRKPDDEFAKINLSFFDGSRKEVVIYCPKSKEAFATQKPKRQSLEVGEEDTLAETPDEPHEEPTPEEEPSKAQEEEAPVPPESKGPSLQEQHFTILC